MEPKQEKFIKYNNQDQKLIPTALILNYNYEILFVASKDQLTIFEIQN